MIVDFNKIMQQLDTENKEKLESSEEYALLQRISIPVIVRALQLYHEQLQADDSKTH